MSDQLPPPGGPTGGAPYPGQPTPHQPTPQPPPGAEYLEQGAGRPIPPAHAAPRRSGRRTAMLAGSVLGLGSLAGAGAWAFLALNGGGPQPAEALPASTWAYVSVDFDPSAGQKVEAVKMLNKFPALEQELGLSPQDDLVERLVDRALEQSPCTHFSYADDVKPWLGQRAALAAVSVADAQVPVAVLQVTDEQAADAGFRAIASCAAHGDAEDTSGVDTAWVVDNGWAYVAEDADRARQVVDAVASGTLAEDADFTSWMQRVGERGILTAYAAPEAGARMADLMDQGVAGLGVDEQGGSDLMPLGGMGEQMRTQLAKFPGMAATLRFSDGGLELEAVGSVPDGNDAAALMGSGAGALASSLPDDTVAAVAGSVQPGWLQGFADQLSSAMGGEGMTADDLFGELESSTGLTLPEDVETLTGQAFALSVGGDFDADTFANSADGSDVPIGYTVRGDAGAIEAVLDKLRPQLGGEDTILGSTTQGDLVAIGPDPAYRDELVAGGGLGDTATFRNVVPHADEASMVMYVDFDGASNWLAELAASDPSARENVEPLSALGVSSWRDGDTAHSLVRLTTD